MEPLAERLARIRDRIEAALDRAGRAPGSVRLLAVTKGFPTATVADALALGLSEIGESRVQEAEKKARELGARGQGGLSLGNSPGGRTWAMAYRLPSGDTAAL